MDSKKIVLFARLKVKAGTENEAKQAALAIVEPSREEEGCINYDMHQAIHDPTVFLWHETWTDEKAIEEHGNSAHFKRFSEQIRDIIEEPLQVILTKMVSENILF